MPSPINNNTEGTPDFFEYKLKKYEIIIMPEKTIKRISGILSFPTEEDNKKE